MKAAEITEARYAFEPNYDVYVNGKRRLVDLSKKEAEEYVDEKIKELERVGVSYQTKDTIWGAELILSSGNAELTIEIRPTGNKQ